MTPVLGEAGGPGPQPLCFCPTFPARLGAKCLRTALRGAQSNAPTPAESRLCRLVLPTGQGQPAISFVKTLTKIKASFKNTEGLPQLVNSHRLRMGVAFEMFALISNLVPKSKRQGRLPVPRREEQS